MADNMRKLQLLLLIFLFSVAVSAQEVSRIPVTDSLKDSQPQIQRVIEKNLERTLEAHALDVYSQRVMGDSGTPTNPCPTLKVYTRTSNGDFYTCNNGSWRRVDAGVAAPGGSPTQVQYNNSGSFGGSSGITLTATQATLPSPVITTPTGIVKGDVGLGNVDNTSDANKPVSTAQQTALNLKQNTITFGTGVQTALGVNIGSAGAFTTNNAANNFSASVLATVFNSCLDAGSTDSYACSLSPALAAYVTGQTVWFKAATANTGAATLNLNSLGAKTIKKNKDSDLADADIKAGQWVAVVYDGTVFQLVSPVSNAAGGITNSAGANIVPKSNGTNLVASRISDGTSGVQINDTNGTKVADFDAQRLYAGQGDVAPGAASLDWGQGYLISPGGTVVLNWDNDNNASFFSGRATITQFDPGSGLVASFNSAYAAFDNITNNAGDGNPNINLLDRQLIADDGASVVLDYSKAAAKLTPTAFASLPASPALGMIAVVSDSNTVTWGATIAGGSTNKVLAFYNGTNWTVFGK